MDEEELITIGKIITHGYICYNVFPVQLSKCSLKYNLFNAVEDVDLIEGFLQFIYERESKFFAKFKNENDKDCSDAILDVLSDFNIFTRPTVENIDTLASKAGKVALIRIRIFRCKLLYLGWDHFGNA